MWSGVGDSVRGVDVRIACALVIAQACEGANPCAIPVEEKVLARLQGALVALAADGALDHCGTARHHLLAPPRGKLDQFAPVWLLLLLLLLLRWR